MGLLWLESHFASVFGSESGWNDDEDLSIDCAEVWELYQAGEFCGLGLNDWTTKTGDDEAYFGRYLLFEDVFATFARFEDVGLLWLDSHFARVFGNESGWSDWPFECNIAEFWQQSQAVMVYIYLIRVDQTFQYGLLEAPCWIANEGNFALPSKFMDLEISLFDQEYPLEPALVLTLCTYAWLHLLLQVHYGVIEQTYCGALPQDWVCWN